MSTPYTGQHPHGAILDTIDGFIRVQGDSGVVIVKRNYGGEGVSKNAVADNPGKYLKAITVMFKRNGYDPETRDWFWVKYRPDGSLDKNPAGMMLAGKVAKGKPKGCIACHTAAPGGDFVFNSNADRYQ
ncbi:MAG: cytochrome P460 family protein [Gammaproteobacteria bacterium]|nr:cytochrome P460 family protein [Gammaproteobacteria bacterium]